MPPVIPLYAFDYKGKSKVNGVSVTRTNMFFSEYPLTYQPSFLLEFGNVIYGPQRRNIHEAKKDHELIEEAASRGPDMLRRAVAKLAHLGGTKSHPHPNVTPVLMDVSKPIRIIVSTENSQEIQGVRRSHVFAIVAESAPSLIMERVVDSLSDLLACSVDSQLGLRPPVDLLLSCVKHAISREMSICPILDDELDTYVRPLCEKMLDTLPWSILKVPSNAEDLEVITGFIRQFLDKSRQADLHGERKQIKRIQKKRRDLKKSLHTVFVNNVPWETTEAELHTLFSKNVPGLSNPIYKVLIPKNEITGAAKGYALVICRSKKATRAVLDKTDWEIAGRSLNLRWRDPTKIESTGKLPAELEEKIAKVVSQNPGCNVSQIPNYLEELDFHKYGFKNLTHALQSVPYIYLELGNSRNITRPVYLAYPK